MLGFAPRLASLLKSLPTRPVDQETLTKLASKTLKECENKSTAENRKSQWEYLLRDDIFTLAATEGSALDDEDTKYYDDLRDKLDLVLTFTELEACGEAFAVTILQDLLETQTITSCSHIFYWIEARAARLTHQMVPQKGKALILLRTLNDLLRRLSKMGSTTIFCGRILTFLSGVFPLGERSGVNLRGEYGPAWEGVKLEKKEEEEAGEGASAEMQVDEVNGQEIQKSALEKKEDFYNTFWSLQAPFARPPLFALVNTFTEFQDAVNKCLPVIKDATTKERSMMGTRNAGLSTSTTLKRKREPEAVDDKNSTEYFFAKFLTSPELLELEIADTHFRRQILFQLLILLHHLLTFTKIAKAAWTSTRNRSLQMDFTLEPPEAQWVQETIAKAIEELKQTAPAGRAFADTVNAILEREKNWVKWKNDLCSPFDKEPWREVVDGVEMDFEESTREARKKMREEPKDWPWSYGSEAMTEIWEMGYRDLHDLQQPFSPGEVKDYAKKIKLEDGRIDMRKRKLAQMAQERTTAAARAKAAAVAKALTAAAPQQKEKQTSPPLLPTPELKPEPIRSTTPLSLAKPVVASSPLHPSLPPKPGTPLRASTSAHDTPPAPAPPPPAPAPTPVVVTLAPAPAPVVVPPAAVPPPPPSVDPEIARCEESKQRWSWLCLRTARDKYLQHLVKIGTGDIAMLADEIEKEKNRREKAVKGEDGLCATNGAIDDGGGSPMISAVNFGGDNDVKLAPIEEVKAEPLASIPAGEGDIKMDDR